MNSKGEVRTVAEASAIARKNGVVIPSWTRIEVDPSIREASSFAEYRLGNGQQNPTDMMRWSTLVPDGEVVVRIHPNVLASDEKIVGVLQHEVWELTELRAQVEARELLPAQEVARSIDTRSAKNLHGQAWDVADLRVLIMRASNPAEKAERTERLTRLIERYKEVNQR